MALYEMKLGFLLGHRFLMLEHRGRRTHRLYRTVLEVVEFDPGRAEVVVMSGWGRRANWYRNIAAGGAVAIHVGRDRFSPEVRLLDDDEAAAVLASYERRNRLVAPVLRRILAALAGFPYDGGASARRRIVQALPLVAFRPRRSGSGSRRAVGHPSRPWT